MALTTFRNNMRITGNLRVDGAITGAGVAAPIGTATATAGAATLNARQGKVTTESLTTAQNADYTLTLTNSQIAAGDIVLVSLANGTNTQGTPIISRVTPAAGSAVIVVGNRHGTSQALNGTLVVSFVVVKAA
jgi:hypothetical protein